MKEIKDELQKLVEKFNSSESKKKERIRDLKRNIVIVFEDDGTYHTQLKDGVLSDIEEGGIEGDIIVTTTTQTFLDILGGREDALSAYITKKIRIKAKLMDKLLIAELLK